MSSSEIKEDNPKEENENNKKEETLTGFTAFFLAILILLIIIGSIITVIIYLNFLLNSKEYNFDKIGFTRLGKNKHFSLCGLYSCVDSWYSSFTFNSMIMLILFFQEVVMSSKWVRYTFIKRAMGDLLFYPKYIIRFLSLFNYCMINMLYQPMNFEDLDVYPKLNLSDYFHPLFLLIPLIYGLYLILSSLYFNLILNDELGICLLINIIKGKPVQFGDYLYGYNIYETVRSPFRAGIMCILLSFNPIWDLGRLLYTFFFWFCLYIEGINDDRYYFEKYDAYKEYIRRVPDRFFNFSFITGKKRKNIMIEKKEEKNDEKDIKRKRRKNNKKKQD